MSAEIGRRAMLVGLALAPSMARAKPRLPVGGRVQLRVPWSLGVLDPHAIDDIASALFGNALFDSLYAYSSGRVVPALAEDMPERDGAGTRVRLRTGVTTARGHAVGAHDVMASIARARAGDGKAWLSAVPVPRRIDDTTLHFATPEASKLAQALASPLCAVVPRGFSPDAPDATGAFAASRDAGALVLARNARAAMGPAQLDSLTVRPAQNLADSLRAFEQGSDDIGWLGLGLHDPRAGAVAFDAGAVGYALLRTGRDAGSWDEPGVAQRLADGINPTLLGHLAPGPAWNVQPDQGWGAAPCEMLVQGDAPYLVELARAVAAALSRAGHEITVVPLPAPAFKQRRASRSYSLAIDAVRPFAPGWLGTLAALATSDNPSLAESVVRYPPHVNDLPTRTMTRTMRIGVVLELHVQGGRIPELGLPPCSSGVDWPMVTRSRR